MDRYIGYISDFIVDKDRTVIRKDDVGLLIGLLARYVGLSAFFANNSPLSECATCIHRRRFLHLEVAEHYKSGCGGGLS